MKTNHLNAEYELSIVIEYRIFKMKPSTAQLRYHTQVHNVTELFELFLQAIPVFQECFILFLPPRDIKPTMRRQRFMRQEGWLHTAP